MNWKLYLERETMIGQDSLIDMEDGTQKKIRDIHVGDIVKGGYKVKHIVKHVYGGFDVAIMNNGLNISLWHPMKLGHFWVFPIHSAHGLKIESDEPMYDMSLDKGHVIIADGIEVCTLGHYIDDQVVRHGYFGTFKVIHDLGCISGEVIISDLKVLRDTYGYVYKWIIM